MAAIKEAHKMDYIMETVGLRKAYKDNIVVDDVNMHISKGAIYGFVGPNGAGKSTVMKMILSLIQPDAGEVQLLGEKVTSHSYEIFKKVGSIIENPYFYDKMTARAQHTTAMAAATARGAQRRSSAVLGFAEQLAKAQCARCCLPVWTSLLPPA